METPCKVCGGQHITGECTVKKEVGGQEEGAEVEYLDINDLFALENLKDDFDLVRSQLEEIRGLVEKYDEHKKKQKIDPDESQYVDEYREKVEDAFKNFKINNKVVDITKLSKEADPKGIFNDIVFEVNDYKQLHMVGSHEMDLEGMQ